MSLKSRHAPGGQAGSSSRIENYLGFPTGVSGQELANRSIAQAQKFGAQIMVAQSVVHIDTSRQPYKVVLESGLKFNARSVVIAAGAQYARLPIEDADAFTGRGIYYNATHMEAQLCDAEEVIVVGGGNSAGQAAIFLAQSSAKLHLFVRSQKLCGRRYSSRKHKTGCFRSRRRFYGGTPGPSIPCRARGARRFSTTNANNARFGFSLAG